jgi:hypothetical protein
MIAEVEMDTNLGYEDGQAVAIVYTKIYELGNRLDMCIVQLINDLFY